VVEHAIGNGEVGSSILPLGTTSKEDALRDIRVAKGSAQAVGLPLPSISRTLHVAPSKADIDGNSSAKRSADDRTYAGRAYHGARCRTKYLAERRANFTRVDEPASASCENSA
jgi:hypothetical protein